MARPLTAGLIMLLVIGLAGCGDAGNLPDNARLLGAFEQGQTGIWLSGHGTVTQLIGDEVLSGETHQRMVVQVSDSLTVVVRHSIERSERVPAAHGDTIAFQGRYEWNGRGGALGRTHHDPEAPGRGGWIEHRGQRYD